MLGKSVLSNIRHSIPLAERIIKRYDEGDSSEEIKINLQRLLKFEGKTTGECVEYSRCIINSYNYNLKLTELLVRRISESKCDISAKALYYMLYAQTVEKVSVDLPNSLIAVAINLFGETVADAAFNSGTTVQPNVQPTAQPTVQPTARPKHSYTVQHTGDVKTIIDPEKPTGRIIVNYNLSIYKQSLQDLLQLEANGKFDELFSAVTQKPFANTTSYNRMVAILYIRSVRKYAGININHLSTVNKCFEKTLLYVEGTSLFISIDAIKELINYEYNDVKTDNMHYFDILIHMYRRYIHCKL